MMSCANNTLCEMTLTLTSLLLILGVDLYTVLVLMERTRWWPFITVTLLFVLSFMGAFSRGICRRLRRWFRVEEKKGYC